MAAHSSILAWRIPWREGPGRLQSIVLQRVGHYQVTEHTHSLTHVLVVIRVLLDEIKSRHAECPGISRHFVQALMHGARLLLKPD